MVEAVGCLIFFLAGGFRREKGKRGRKGKTHRIISRSGRREEAPDEATRRSCPLRILLVGKGEEQKRRDDQGFLSSVGKNGSPTGGKPVDNHAGILTREKGGKGELCFFYLEKEGGNEHRVVEVALEARRGGEGGGTRSTLAPSRKGG